MSKKKKRVSLEYEDAELNIMPFIDVFSVLNTFLLFSAVFISLGTVKVQIPFFSNKQTDAKPTRSLEVKVDVEKDNINLITNYTLPPRNEKPQKFPMTEVGLEALRAELVKVRMSKDAVDIVTLLTDDDLIYNQVIQVIDIIKTKRPTDPDFPPIGSAENAKQYKDFMFPKVVMGSVIL